MKEPEGRFMIQDYILMEFIELRMKDTVNKCAALKINVHLFQIKLLQ